MNICLSSLGSARVLLFFVLCHSVPTWCIAAPKSLFFALLSSSFSPGFICRCHRVVMTCQGKSCSLADEGALTSQTSPTTPSICGASWRTASGRSSPKSPCLWVFESLVSLMDWHESVRLNFSSPFRSGELQRAFVDAAAALRRLGVSWALGQGGSLWLLPGADVPGCCLLCLVLFHHSPSDSKALQPPPGWDLWARSPGGVWLPLTVWAGNGTAAFTHGGGGVGGNK